MDPKYLNMIRKMENTGEKDWSVYILRCGDGSLYTGVAKDVASRVKAHQCGKGAAYTKTHLPVELVYQEDNFSRSEALIREAAIKRMPRPAKQKLTWPSTSS